MPEYFLILVFLLCSTVLLHCLSQVKLFKSLKHFLGTFAIIILVGTLWDQLAISRGHWSFGERFLLGPRLGAMPIEEFGFFFVTFYFAFVVYKIFERKS